jgi:acyl-CoA reductase-like NAD-dependent aldehyde dehydrogenase
VKQGLLIGGSWVLGESWFQVSDRFTGKVIAEVAAATEGQVAEAVAAARAAFLGDRLTPYDRYEVLLAAAGNVMRAREEFERTIVAETGFTFADAKGEVDRCVQTLTVTAEEAKRVTGEMVPIDGAPRQRRRMAYTIRVPRGVVCAITPFNSPLNTVTHKVAPALAAGNTVVLKPSSHTPLTAGLLCRAVAEAGLPDGYLNLVSGSGRNVGQWLAGNESIRFFTFTGSTEVGRALRREAGLRPTSLELGSISSTMICEDADLDDAVGKCISAAFRKAGQVCTSIQRLYVHDDVFASFMERMLEATAKLKVGDPWKPETDVGPMVDVGEAERVETWVREARAGGARVLCGGGRRGPVMEPTILTEANPTAQVMCREVFGPLVTVSRYSDLDVAVASINDTPYGLAAGVFTRDLGRAVELTRRLHMGSVHINQTSSSRVDLMPYGGAKDSGPGREGPRYAIEDMTEERLVTISW